MCICTSDRTEMDTDRRSARRLFHIQRYVPSGQGARSWTRWAHRPPFGVHTLQTSCWSTESRAKNVFCKKQQGKKKTGSDSAWLPGIHCAYISPLLARRAFPPLPPLFHFLSFSPTTFKPSCHLTLFTSKLAAISPSFDISPVSQSLRPFLSLNCPFNLVIHHRLREHTQTT